MDLSRGRMERCLYAWMNEMWLELVGMYLGRTGLSMSKWFNAEGSIPNVYV